MTFCANNMTIINNNNIIIIIIISLCSVIVWVSVVLKRTVGDSD